MNNSIKLLTTIPFEGFYESLLDYYIDQEVDSYMQDKVGGAGYPEYELNYPDYTIDHEKIAKEWVGIYKDWLESKHGVKLPSLTFESLKMPREYNFNTDVIYCHIGIADALKLYNRVTFPNTDKLAQLLKDNFTSSSGFHSFYSNELEDYLSKSIEQLDHNELGILFPVPESDEFFTLWENSACNGFFTNVINFCSEP